jgi:hypothetical protein
VWADLSRRPQSPPPGHRLAHPAAHAGRRGSACRRAAGAVPQRRGPDRPDLRRRAGRPHALRQRQATVCGCRAGPARGRCGGSPLAWATPERRERRSALEGWTVGVGVSSQPAPGASLGHDSAAAAPSPEDPRRAGPAPARGTVCQPVQRSTLLAPALAGGLSPYGGEGEGLGIRTAAERSGRRPYRGRPPSGLMSECSRPAYPPAPPRARKGEGTPPGVALT